jgi:BASS family bile acid:Na+ symporter
MDVIEVLFQWLVVIFIVATMFSVGLTTTLDDLGKVFGNAWFVVGALVASLVVVPLLGLGIAELFDLPTPAYIALVLVGASAGGPFSAALNKNQKGDVLTGAAMMTMLALIGSVATPIIANWLFGLTDTVSGSVGDIAVGELVRTIVILQIIPLAIGMAMRSLTPRVAASWSPGAGRIASVSFAGVLLGIVLGGFSAMIDLLGTRTLLAALVAGVAFFAAGWLLSPGPEQLRSTAGFVAGVRNAAPVLVIVYAAFSGVEGIVPALIAIYLVVLAVYLPLAAWLGNRHAAQPDDLTVIEGIGPAIEGVLNHAGITTLYELSTTDAGDLEIILTGSDVQLNLHEPDTWPVQASLAVDGKAEELAAFQDHLKGGRLES